MPKSILPRNKTQLKQVLQINGRNAVRVPNMKSNNVAALAMPWISSMLASGLEDDRHLSIMHKTSGAIDR